MREQISLRNGAENGSRETYEAVNIKQREVGTWVPLCNQGLIRRLIFVHVVQRRHIFVHLFRNRSYIARLIRPVVIRPNPIVSSIRIEGSEIQRSKIGKDEIAAP